MPAHGGLLDLAGNGGSAAALAQRLDLLLVSDALPDLKQLQQEMALRPTLAPAQKDEAGT